MSFKWLSNLFKIPALLPNASHTGVLYGGISDGFNLKSWAEKIFSLTEFNSLWASKLNLIHSLTDITNTFSSQIITPITSTFNNLIVTPVSDFISDLLVDVDVVNDVWTAQKLKIKTVLEGIVDDYVNALHSWRDEF